MMTDLLVDGIANAVIERLRPMLRECVQVKPRVLTVEQAAQYIGRTEVAVRCLLQEKAFPAVKADRRVMIDVQDLDRWIDWNKQS